MFRVIRQSTHNVLRRRGVRAVRLIIGHAVGLTVTPSVILHYPDRYRRVFFLDFFFKFIILDSGRIDGFTDRLFFVFFVVDKSTENRRCSKNPRPPVSFSKNPPKLSDRIRVDYGYPKKWRIFHFLF